MKHPTGLIGGYTDEQLHEIVENSYHNFHVKGFDYICLKRSTHHTVKIYFFDGNLSTLPEVVSPHNHRYNFETTVLNGRLKDTRYQFSNCAAETYNLFAWHTPLNGGEGFEWRQEVGIRKSEEVILEKGFVPYSTNWSTFHTINIAAPDTVIRLDQWSDVIPDGEPTFTLMRDKTAPSLAGLYEKFQMDALINRLNQTKQLGVSV